MVIAKLQVGDQVNLQNCTCKNIINMILITETYLKSTHQSIKKTSCHRE